MSACEVVRVDGVAPRVLVREVEDRGREDC